MKADMQTIYVVGADYEYEGVQPIRAFARREDAERWMAEGDMPKSHAHVSRTQLILDELEFVPAAEGQRGST